MKAIRRLFVQEYKIEAMSIANLTSEKAKQEEEILFQKAMLENDKWNESVAKDRMIRLREEEAVRKATVLSEKLRKQALKEERLEKAAEELRQLQVLIVLRCPVMAADRSDY